MISLKATLHPEESTISDAISCEEANNYLIQFCKIPFLSCVNPSFPAPSPSKASACPQLLIPAAVLSAQSIYILMHSLFIIYLYRISFKLHSLHPHPHSSQLFQAKLPPSGLATMLGLCSLAFSSFHKLISLFFVILSYIYYLVSE